MVNDQLLLHDVKKIAVVRANAIGDFIVTLPALGALKETYPDAELILLGKQWHQDFFIDQRSPVDRVIVMPVIKGLREESGLSEDLNQVNDFIHYLKQEKFDIAIHFHGNGISGNKFISQLNARLTIGLSCKESEYKPDLTYDFYYYQPEVLRYLEIVSLAGAATTQIHPELKILEEDKQLATSYIKSNLTKEFIVIHPCGTDIRRMWTKENLAETADAFLKSDYEVVFTGSKDDYLYVNEVISLMKNKPHNACGKLSLSGLTGMLSMAQLVISCDTGPLHLARAVNAKTIGLYWAPNLINWGPLSRKNHRPVISWKMNCKYCGIIPNNPWPYEPHSSTCQHLYSFIEDISVDDVVKEAEVLLNKRILQENISVS